MDVSGATITIREGELSPRAAERLAEIRAVDATVNRAILKAKVQALREAGDALDALQTREVGLPVALRRDPALWLYERADELEKSDD